MSDGTALEDRLDIFLVDAKVRQRRCSTACSAPNGFAGISNMTAFGIPG